jgi:hypothetical protein
MDAHTIHQENSPGWRELVEGLYAQIEAARAREAVLLEATRARETALLRIIEHDRQALAALTRTGRSYRASEGAPRVPSASPLHAQIMAVLAQYPAGCTRAEIEAALDTNRPLEHVLRGLWRRGRLARVGPGRYALPGHNETGRTA